MFRKNKRQFNLIKHVVNLTLSFSVLDVGKSKLVTGTIKLANRIRMPVSAGLLGYLGNTMILGKRFFYFEQMKITSMNNNASRTHVVS